MSTKNFTKEYFRLNEEDAIDYAVSRLNYFESKNNLKCVEIGDGNLNYIFKVYNEVTNKSVILKQAGPIARISKDIKLSPDRNRIESEILKLQFELTKGEVPEVYNYDPIMNCTAMEDLSDHTILRTALLDYTILPELAEQLSDFMVQTLLPTTDLVMDHKEKKLKVKNYINPELCEISEDLVFTEPYFDAERNDMLSATKEYVSREIWQDVDLKLEVSRLKFDFMTNAEALLHGDLHSGSIFAKEDSMKVIDPEFAFYGPAGYDVGNALSHFIFAILNAQNRNNVPDEFLPWLEETLVSTLDLFIEKYNREWDLQVTEYMAKTPGFKEMYMTKLLKDTASYAGTEIIRRIVGLAHVIDITELPEAQRLEAEKKAIEIGKKLIKESSSFTTGADYLKLVK